MASTNTHSMDVHATELDEGVDPPKTRAGLKTGGHVRSVKLTEASGADVIVKGPVCIIVLTDLGLVGAGAHDAAWRGQKVHIKTVQERNIDVPDGEQMALVERMPCGAADGGSVLTWMRIGDIDADTTSVSTQYHQMIRGVSRFCNTLHRADVRKPHLYVCINPDEFEEKITSKQVEFLDNPAHRFQCVSFSVRIDLRACDPFVGAMPAVRAVLDTIETGQFVCVHDAAVLSAMRLLGADPAVCVQAASWPAAGADADGVCVRPLAEDIECAVCLDSAGGGFMTVSPCRHIVHGKCVQQWCTTFLGRVPGQPEKDVVTCPICRGAIFGFEVVGGCESHKRRRDSEGDASANPNNTQRAIATSNRMLAKVQQLNKRKEREYQDLVHKTRFVAPGATEASCFKSCLCACEACAESVCYGFVSEHTPLAAMQWLANRAGALNVYAQTHTIMSPLDSIDSECISRIIGPWKFRGSGGDGTSPKMMLLIDAVCCRIGNSAAHTVQCTVMSIGPSTDVYICAGNLLVPPTTDELVEWKQTIATLAGIEAGRDA